MILEPECPQVTPNWLGDLRASAQSRHDALGIPTMKHEEWKYTSLRGLNASTFAPASFVPVALEQVQPYLLGLTDALRIVFVNGYYSEELTTSLRGVDGLEIRTLNCVIGGEPEKVTPFLGQIATYDDMTFAAKNTAQFSDGAYIRIARNASIERPVQVLFINTAGVECNPRLLIHAEPGSKATVIETYASIGEDTGFTNAVCEVYVEQNAHLELVKAQLESPTSFHIALCQAKQERDSTFLTYNVTLGGHLTRNDINVFLNGENCHCRMDGIYALDNEQVCDNHTRLDHAFPNCDSFEVYKGVLDGHSTGVFNGKIYVHEHAQKTDAKQTNQALLLSPTATINTKPQLEIFADDVKCTHGATVGQLRSDALFYLRSRGIPEADARALLVYAFAAEVLEKISVESVRNDLEQRLFTKLGV